MVFAYCASPPSAGSCTGWPLFCKPFCLIVTISFACRYIELQHPVYGVLFQCVTVQLLAQSAMFMVLLVGVFFLDLEKESWSRVVSTVGVFVRQFYEVTWACVTHLR